MFNHHILHKLLYASKNDERIVMGIIIWNFSFEVYPILNSCRQPEARGQNYKVIMRSQKVTIFLYMSSYEECQILLFIFLESSSESDR